MKNYFESPSVKNTKLKDLEVGIVISVFVIKREISTQTFVKFPSGPNKIMI